MKDRYWCGDPFVPDLIRASLENTGYSPVVFPGRSRVSDELLKPLNHRLVAKLKGNERFKGLKPELKRTAQIDVWMEDDRDVIALEVKTRMYLQREADYKRPNCGCEHSIYHFSGLDSSVEALLRLPSSAHEQLRSVCELLIYGLCLGTHHERFAGKRPHIGIVLPFYINQERELPVIQSCLGSIKQELQPVFSKPDLPTPELGLFMLSAKVDSKKKVPDRMWLEPLWHTRGFRVEAPKIRKKAISSTYSNWLKKNYNHHGCSDCKHLKMCISKC